MRGQDRRRAGAGASGGADAGVFTTMGGVSLPQREAGPLAGGTGGRIPPLGRCAPGGVAGQRAGAGESARSGPADPGLRPSPGGVRPLLGFQAPRLPVRSQVRWPALANLMIAGHAAYLFIQMISRCYQRGKVLITSNRLVMEWGWDQVVATAIHVRLLWHSHVLINRGDSYRLREKRQGGQRGIPDQVAQDAASTINSDTTTTDETQIQWPPEGANQQPGRGCSFRVARGTKADFA
jgi:hypothetical protein